MHHPNSALAMGPVEITALLILREIGKHPARTICFLAVSSRSRSLGLSDRRCAGEKVLPKTQA